MSHDHNENKKRSREVVERFELLVTEINIFLESYLKITFDIHAREEEAKQREIEEKIKFFTLATPFTHLYIAKLNLFQDHSITLHECYQLRRQLNHYINTYESAPPKIIGIRDYFDKHILLVDNEVHALMNFYVRHSNTAFKEDIRSKVEDNPALKAWVHPFFNREEGVDPLEQAVEEAAKEDLKRQKVEKIETIKTVFELEVEEKLSEFHAQVNAHLDCLDEFDERFESAGPHQTYREKVALYAEYCSTVLKQLLHTKNLLLVCINVAEKCIREINDPIHVDEMTKVLCTLTDMRDMLAKEVDAVHEPMRALAEVYSANEKYLSIPLKVFMDAWLSPGEISPLLASITAYEHSMLSISEKETDAPAASVSPSQNRRM